MQVFIPAALLVLEVSGQALRTFCSRILGPFQPGFQMDRECWEADTLVGPHAEFCVLLVGECRTRWRLSPEVTLWKYLGRWNEVGSVRPIQSRQTLPEALLSTSPADASWEVVFWAGGICLRPAVKTLLLKCRSWVSRYKKRWGRGAGVRDLAQR